MTPQFPDTFVVRLADARDASAMAAVHEQAFVGFFLTRLGGRFLRRFYRAIIDSEMCIAYVADAEPGLLGFAVGPISPRQFYRRLLLTQGVFLVLDALPALVASPWFVARHLARGLTFRGDVPPVRTQAVLLSSICVLPHAAGKGVASGLLTAFCAEAAQRGAANVYLTTDRDDNAAAIAFYRRHGFVPDAEIQRPDGRVLTRYVRGSVAG